ncbi:MULTISPECIES: ATP-binding cassette domain-containing protein [unclassified Rhizobium]|uniref:ATP-binding cassette domain-containing protein n=1 Tax=unclassified Rhizobium TaxID=2613769 RepID=UPI001ADBF3EF|nr:MULTISPECIES: ATP-binding cassette domain-containing protein [unclassified Rhizobium]MBO9127901.1 sugar ABC transporter ATP-binding protein [Rhizobium sp. 16-488-2b]MBO9178295.1 sugar ABC transporter ATP-binding protein [Rhizobium sp. 16-488-2a]
MKNEFLLRVTDLSKSYGAVQALQGVSFNMRAGETIALVGDNGAGKSTLVKLLSGVLRPTSGSIDLNGSTVDLTSPDVARSNGIETVYQDLGLCNNLTVAENIFLGREEIVGWGPFSFLARARMRQKAKQALDGLSINVPSPDQNVTGLSGGQRQAVSIARTRLWKSTLVMLDEPTAALGVQETAKAMEAVRRLQKAGVAIILITHSMPMAKEMSDRVVVLRRGKKVGDVRTDSVSGDEIVSLITGAREQQIEAA